MTGDYPLRKDSTIQNDPMPSPDEVEEPEYPCLCGHPKHPHKDCLTGCNCKLGYKPQPTGGVEPLSARQQIDLENTKHAIYTSTGMRLTDVQAQAMSDFLKRELAAERTAAKVEELAAIEAIWYDLESDTYARLQEHLEKRAAELRDTKPTKKQD